LREYNIDLIEEADNLTWRKFKNLLRALSADSALARSVRSDEEAPVEDTEGKMMKLL
jgi:hypothetical protein